jgi:AcrR family transcriptional regulator
MSQPRYHSAMPQQERRSRSAKKEDILVAAQEVFLRFGYRKTTMGDIAAAADVSRPVLYTFYANKELIFADVIGKMNADKISELLNSASRLPTPRDRLQHICEQWGADGFALAERYPSSSDFFDPAQPGVQEMFDGFAAALAELLKNEFAPGHNLKLKPHDAARTIVLLIRGLKFGAKDKSSMTRLIRQALPILLDGLID